MTPRPSSTGINRSSNTMRGALFASISSASCPFVAVSVGYPSSERTSTSILRIVGSSSTMRIVGVWAIVLPPLEPIPQGRAARRCASPAWLPYPLLYCDSLLLYSRNQAPLNAVSKGNGHGGSDGDAHARGHHSPLRQDQALGGAIRGRQKLNREPCPSRLSTQMSPPIASTYWRQIHSPRPVPRTGVTSDCESRTNFWKRRV